MQIIRKPRPQRNFTMFDNAMLRDDELSLKALGLLVRLLSYPDGWRTDYRTLAKQFKLDGETSFRTAYKELERAGYLSRQKIRDADGRWTTVTTIHEEPQREVASSQVSACGDFPPGILHAGEPPLLRSTDTNDLEEDDLYSVDAAAPTDDEEKLEIEDWRATDRRLFADLIDGTHLRSEGRGPWRSGIWPKERFYNAFRKSDRKKLTWPGRYLESLQDGEGVEDFLIDQGLEPVTP